MTRSHPVSGPALAMAAGMAVVAIVFAASWVLWPRYAAEKERALAAARTWAAATIPTAALDRSRTELRPTPHGWRVVFRGVDTPCEQTSWGCRAGPNQADDGRVYQDLWVCVEYGTGRGYMIAGTFRPVGGVTPTTCRPIPLADQR